MVAGAQPFLEQKIVTIGGGSGGFIVNRGLTQYPVYPTAVCTVFDSGGSTGRLLDEFGSLPQGDIRRCILALASDDQDSLREIFNHRFEGTGNGLSKHNVGNVLLLAAEQLWGPIEGIRRVSKLLGIKGAVLPVSIDKAQLIAELSDGSKLEGEAAIDTRPYSDPRTIVHLSLQPAAFICREAADALRDADIIVIGPGDLYTSLVPNFLVTGVAESIRQSSARIVYVANIMTKYAETNTYSVADFIDTLFRYDIGADRIDTVLINTTALPEDLLQLYAQEEKAFPVGFDKETQARIQARVEHVVTGDFLSTAGLAQKLIRHDSLKLARAIVGLEK